MLVAVLFIVKEKKRKKEEMKCGLIDLGYIHTTQRHVVITDVGPAQPLGDILTILDRKRGGHLCSNQSLEWYASNLTGGYVCDGGGITPAPTQRTLTAF